jgi:beta-lactamase regulating signal transducer with metallopeptidase domain
MNALSSEMIERLGWVLVHSVWQFAVVAIVAGMLVAVLRRRTATSRYAVLVTAMLLIVAVPCATWMMIPQPAAFEISDLKSQIEHTDTMETVPPLENSIDEVTLVSPNAAIAPPIYEEGDQTRRADAVPRAKSLTELVRPWFSWIVGGWLIGVLLCSLRPLLGWRMLRRLRRIGISPPSDDVLAAFTRVYQQLGLRRAVKVFHSTLATGPLVVGYLKPVVLLPVSLVTSIPLSQLEAILAHELAHIRRHDFIINLFQTLMETLFFYHPAVWWLSRRICIEREHCCDDLVVRLFNNGIDYGRALLAIAQLQSQRTVLALGAADGSLLGRIRRISGATSHQSRFFPWLATPIALSVVCGMWMAGQEFNVVAETQVNVNSIAASEPESSPRPMQADLPTGVRVKLVGVTTPIVLTDNLRNRGFAGAIAPLPNAESPDTRQWWSGDGLKLDMAPEPGRSWMVRKEWEDGRQFAFEISGLPDSDSELNVVMFHDRAAEPQQAVMIEVSKSQLDPGKRIILGSIAPNAEAVSATLELRIGTGKSATVKFDTDGKRIDSLADTAALHSDSMRQIIANIKFLRVVQNGENVDVWTRPITTNGKLGSVRYSIVDKTGKSHSSPGGYSMNDEQLTPFKNLSVANIREVHFEIRAFDHSVMFENVSLKPGNKSDVRVTVASLPEEKTPVGVTSESKDPKPIAIDAADAAQVAHFTGVVKDDKGQPLAGARIYILPFASGKKDPGPVRATTDKDGLFEFDAMDMTYSKYDGTPALHDGLLIATKEGYGPDSFHTWGNRNDGLRDWTTPVKGAKIDLQLAKDDVPVRGRLLNPDGKPLVRANVNVEAIGLPIKFNLDTHLKAEAEADIGRGFLTGAKVYERSLGRPELVPDLITQLQTDTDGRFEITGVGHERLVTLSVRHSSIQDARIEVMSRVAPDVGTIRDFEGKATSTLHGSGFTRQMSPGLTLTGIVRDRRSKAPISGMWVTIFGDPVKYAYYNRNPAVTDANGRFTITGLNPVYATQAIEKRDIAAYPQPGIPYLMAKAFFTSNEETIIECEPGIPFRLKVVDEIGRPVEGGVFYRPITPNPVIEELVKPLRGNSFDGVSMRALRRDDGTYEGFVLPGPGAIVFDATQRYVFRPALVDPKAFFEPLRMDWPANSETIYGTGDTLATIFQSNDPQTRHEAIVLVNPPDDSKPLELTATVLKDRPRQVSLIDPEGKPVAGVDSRMRWPDRETNEALNSATFVLRGLHPDRVKQMTFFHKERNLTGILLARGDSDEPMTVILQPSAVVTGRLSFQDGKPRNNFYLAMRATDEGVDVLRLGELGRDGIFRIEGLIPGLSFSSVNSGNVLRFVSLEGKPVENLILKPGEVRDVGEVRVVPAEPTNAGGVPE